MLAGLAITGISLVDLFANVDKFWVNWIQRQLRSRPRPGSAALAREVHTFQACVSLKLLRIRTGVISDRCVRMRDASMYVKRT